MSEDDDIHVKILELHDELKQAISEVRARVRNLEEEWVGEDVVPVKVTQSTGARSLFSDIDE